MAIFHASMKVFVRSKGQTAPAAAAYRAGARYVDDRTGITHDYTRRSGVVSVETFTPADAPPGQMTRSVSGLLPKKRKTVWMRGCAGSWR